VRVHIQIDVVGQARLLLDQPRLDRLAWRLSRLEWLKNTRDTTHPLCSSTHPAVIRKINPFSVHAARPVFSGFIDFGMGAPHARGGSTGCPHTTFGG
jgi:hypothetical protein